MASGQSRRFQSPGTPWQNKLLADFLGGPLLGRILDLTDTAPLAARTVVTRSAEVAAYCRARGVDVLLHGQPERSDTIRLGLARAEALAAVPLAGCMFCPSDQPLLGPESLLALLHSFSGQPERIHRLYWPPGNSPGNPVIFPRRLFPALGALPAGAGGSFLIEKYPEQVTLVPVREDAELLDVDTREDLARLAALAGRI